MNIQNVFGDFILSEMLSIDNDKIEEFCYHLKTIDKGKRVSNRDGWHSNTLVADDPLCLPLHDLFDNSIEKAYSIKKQLGFADSIKFRIKEAWVNVNSRGCWMENHTHGNCFLTCVYYVKAPINSGDITFVRTSNKYSKEFLETQSVYTEHAHSI